MFFDNGVQVVARFVWFRLVVVEWYCRNFLELSADNHVSDDGYAYDRSYGIER